MKRIVQKISSMIASAPTFFEYIGARYFGKPFWEVTVAGTTVRLYFYSRLHYLFAKNEAHGDIEPELMQLWLSQKGTLVYDIGGYNGIYGLLYAKANPASKVTIFEPDTINAKHIEKNIEMNQLHNCTCVRAAITDHDGFVSFSQGGRSKEHIVGESGNIKAMSLSSLPHADLIKLDIEGAEGRALSTLSYPTTILLELHSDAYLSRFGDTQASVLQGLEKQGLSAKLIEKRDTESHYLITKAS
jgi:FkbM family methyltransferase